MFGVNIYLGSTKTSCRRTKKCFTVTKIVKAVISCPQKQYYAAPGKFLVLKKVIIFFENDKICLKG